MSQNAPKVGKIFKARKDDGTIVQGIIESIDSRTVKDSSTASAGELTFEMLIKFTNGEELTVGVFK